MAFNTSGTLVTDQREIAISETWETQTDWEAYQSIDGIEISNGTLQLSELTYPDTTVSRYDASEDNTGSITTITDREGNNDLSGNATVENRINGLNTYYFNGSQDASTSNTLASNDPFALVYVAEMVGTNENAGWLDGGSDTELLHYDNGNGDWSFFRGGSRLDYTPGTKTTSPNLWVFEAFGGNQARVEIDGNEIVNGTTISSDLTGLILANRANGNEPKEIYFGELVVLENHSDSDLQSVKSLLQDKWSTPVL